MTRTKLGVLLVLLVAVAAGVGAGIGTLGPTSYVVQGQLVYLPTSPSTDVANKNPYNYVDLKVVGRVAASAVLSDPQADVVRETGQSFSIALAGDGTYPVFELQAVATDPQEATNEFRRLVNAMQAKSLSIQKEVGADTSNAVQSSLAVGPSDPQEVAASKVKQVGAPVVGVLLVGGVVLGGLNRRSGGSKVSAQHKRSAQPASITI